MESATQKYYNIENNKASLLIDACGGAIIDFHLKNKDGINPLSFRFAKEQMPANNKDGAVYQGHFVCAPRWGPSSQQEARAGLPDHGEFANTAWNITGNTSGHILMKATSHKEEMSLQRSVYLDHKNAVFLVSETFRNHLAFGRPFNVVQHPTIAAPFLDNSVVISCNAYQGFAQLNESSETLRWPVTGVDNPGLRAGLTEKVVNEVYSFTISDDDFGWIAAFNKKYNLLFGYVWKKEDYPWIHIWQYFESKQIKYVGLEFGTAGIHKPFKQLLEDGYIKLNTRTTGYLEAQESITKKYLCFLFQPSFHITEINKIFFDESYTSLSLSLNTHQQYSLQTNFSDYDV